MSKVIIELETEKYTNDINKYFHKLFHEIIESDLVYKMQIKITEGEQIQDLYTFANMNKIKEMNK